MIQLSKLNKNLINFFFKLKIPKIFLGPVEIEGHLIKDILLLRIRVPPALL